MFSKILIANRGEIAVRIIRACKEMGVATVAVYSEADKNALHVALADQSYCIGGPEASESYLNENQIISTAILAGAQAIHPGYGFLSENAHFARACRKNGLVFIGPDPESMERIGNKALLKELIRSTCLTVIPGTKTVASVAEARQAADGIGYPVMLKACAGGGGRGIRLIHSEDELEDAYYQATSEAVSAFGDGSVYLEKYIFLQGMLNCRFLLMNTEMQCALVTGTALSKEETKSCWKKLLLLPLMTGSVRGL